MKRVVSLALILLSATGLVCCQSLFPCAGYIHFHTKRSDGLQTVDYYKADALARHLSFIIPTDHDPTALDQWHFANYCRSISIPGRLVIIPGAEITAKWNSKKKNGLTLSHSLALNYSGDPIIESLQNKYDTQLSIAKRLPDIGVLSIAAHPDLETAVKQRFWFDYRQSQTGQLVNGMEFFNSLNKKQEDATFKRYISFLSYGRRVFPTSGCDDHLGWSRKERLTWTYTEAVTEADILRSFWRGRTYAADKGAWLASYTAVPGFEPFVLRGPVQLVFDVGFAGERRDTVNFEVWKDGRLKTSVKKKIAGTNNRYRFGIVEQKPQKGIHWYVIRIPGYLVTSPYVFDIR